MKHSKMALTTNPAGKALIAVPPPVPTQAAKKKAPSPLESAFIPVLLSFELLTLLQ